MATTFVFEELDDATRNYLLDVRKRDGRGCPGVFIPGSSSLPMVGCLLGPVIVVATLLVTLLSDVILNSPFRVAMLQTAGVMLGGWMFVAAFRVWAGKNSAKVAGNWTYADPLYLYQAAGEQLTVTPMADVTEARATHNYQNGAYQNTAVVLAAGGRKPLNLSLANEKRAEAMVVYFNYLAWARGTDGGGRATLPPAVLGGVAKYVAKNDQEPLEADGQLNLNLIELEVGEVPEEPRRDGRGGFHVLPYLALLVLGGGFFLMMWALNVPFHDEAAFQQVTSPPVQPLALREYLADPGNTKYRDDVFKKLAGFYVKPIEHVKAQAKDPVLRKGMVETLEELQKAEQPAVAIRVTEEKPPKDLGEAKERVEALRTAFVKGTAEQFTAVSDPIRAPDGMVFLQQPPPLGEQLIFFAEPPEDKNPHFDIRYQLVPDPEHKELFTVTWSVAVRLKVEDEQPLVKKEFTGTKTYKANQTADAIKELGDRLIEDAVGRPKPAFPLNPPPGFNLPRLNLPAGVDE